LRHEAKVRVGTESDPPAKTTRLFILDEPTTGLHFEDIRLLLAVLQRLVNQGDSLVVIEHNLDVLKCADWIIDLGPEAELAGGRVVAAGTPETICRHVPRSHHLKSLSSRNSSTQSRRAVSAKPLVGYANGNAALGALRRGLDACPSHSDSARASPQPEKYLGDIA